MPAQVQQIFQDFAASQRNLFELSTRPRVIMKTLFNRAYTRGKSYTSPFAPIPVWKCITGIERAYRTWGLSIYRMIEADPNRFAVEPRHPYSISPHNPGNPGFEDEVRDESVLRNGHTPEDWNRAYWLLKGYAWYT